MVIRHADALGSGQQQILVWTQLVLTVARCVIQMTLTRRITCELIGTGMLVAAVVGSGIMGKRLAGGNIAIALLANTLATGAALVSS